MGTENVFQVFYYLAFNLTKAITAFIQRDSFLYWPFLLSAGVLALVIASPAARPRASHERQAWWQLVRAGMSARLWWHASARADYRLYFANALVLPLLFGVLMFADGDVVILINSAVGLPAAPVENTALGSGDLAARVAFTVVFFIAYDFGRFVAHCLLHDIPVLWEFHKVHHSAETLNPITTFRAHPVDLLVMAWVPVVITGVVTWCFNHLTGTPVSFYTYVGLHVLLFASNLVGTLRHTHVWLSYGPSWGKWFISPAQHQLHHSCEPNHIGCNRGFELAVWDRLYGTLYVPVKQEVFRMGLGDGTDGEWHNVRRMYLWPFVCAARRLTGSSRPQDFEVPPSRPSV